MVTKGAEYIIRLLSCSGCLTPVTNSKVVVGGDFETKKKNKRRKKYRNIQCIICLAGFVWCKWCALFLLFFFVLFVHGLFIDVGLPPLHSIERVAGSKMNMF
jgi:energy-converting hydrogenase Eha subunit G